MYFNATISSHHHNCSHCSAHNQSLKAPSLQNTLDITIPLPPCTSLSRSPFDPFSVFGSFFIDELYLVSNIIKIANLRKRENETESFRTRKAEVSIKDKRKSLAKHSRDRILAKLLSQY